MERIDNIHWTTKNAGINKLNGWDYTFFMRHGGYNNLGHPFNKLEEVYNIVIEQYRRRNSEKERVRIALRPSRPDGFSVMYYQEDGTYWVLGYVVKGDASVGLPQINYNYKPEENKPESITFYGHVDHWRFSEEGKEAMKEAEKRDILTEEDK
jgi:hypothetical protein